MSTSSLGVRRTVKSSTAVVEIETQMSTTTSYPLQIISRRCSASRVLGNLRKVRRRKWMSNQSVRSVEHNQDRISCWNNLSPFRFLEPRSESCQSNNRDVPRSTAQDHGGQHSQQTAGHGAKELNHVELSRKARLLNHKAFVNDALWEAAVRHFGNVSVHLVSFWRLTKDVRNNRWLTTPHLENTLAHLLKAKTVLGNLP